MRHTRRSLKPGGVFLTDAFSPYPFPSTRGGLEASARACSGARVAIDVR